MRKSTAKLNIDPKSKSEVEQKAASRTGTYDERSTAEARHHVVTSRFANRTFPSLGLQRHSGSARILGGSLAVRTELSATFGRHSFLGFGKIFEFVSHVGLLSTRAYKTVAALLVEIVNASEIETVRSMTTRLAALVSFHDSGLDQ